MSNFIPSQYFILYGQLKKQGGLVVAQWELVEEVFLCIEWT
jgi:hypothetical protein